LVWDILSYNNALQNAERLHKQKQAVRESQKIRIIALGGERFRLNPQKGDRALDVKW
jgi:hypothetical protein